MNASTTAATQSERRTASREPWGRWGFLLAAFAVLGLALRLWHLGAEGFGDDEVHKWLAANRYLGGDFGGDDVEHPMLMKGLIVLTLLVARGWASPEAITRFPNAVAGAASVVALAFLGRRLHGRTAGLIAAGLAAFSTTLIGYQRVAKEDTLLGLFVIVLCWALVEARTAADEGRSPARWELRAAAAVGAMLASKYFVFLAAIPVVYVLWIRGETTWRIPPRRWLVLIGVAFVVFAALNWTPFMPSTWAYAHRFIATGGETVHGQYYFMGKLYRNLVPEGLRGTPPWFYAVFLGVKLAPLTAVCALIGLCLAVAGRHKLVLSWILVWAVPMLLSGSKWGRFAVSVFPAFLLLAAYAATRARRAVPALAAVLILWEAAVAVRHAPTYRLYINGFGGGDHNTTWFFPHCDYFDSGLREAIEKVARAAEPGAEIDSDLEWLGVFPVRGTIEYSRLYAEWFGRRDLHYALLRRGRACRTGAPCYVLIHAGRHYSGNEEARAFLGQRPPWDVVRIQGEDVVRVYRLSPGESPFPPAPAAVGGQR